MDNTLKLLISVLSIAGLIALFTPSATEEAPQTSTAEAAAKAMPDKVAEPEVVPVVDEETDDEDLLAAFGEPMNDGNPIDPLKEEEADSSEDANSGQASNDATPQFGQPVSEKPAIAGTTAPTPAGGRPPPPAIPTLPPGKPIPGAPKVDRSLAM